MAFRLHKEGKASIIIALILSTIITFVAILWVQLMVIQIILFALAAFILITILQFFRNPKRQTELNPKHIIAPADGKVVAIEEVEESEYINEKCIQISIFMSVTNVHANRYPCSGEIKYVKYHPGKFLVAWHPKSSQLNERTTIAIENEQKDIILLRQIAGAVARRIVYYCKQDDKVIQGKPLGFIKFGSRVDVLLPVHYKTNVKLGDKVVGAETIISSVD